MKNQAEAPSAAIISPSEAPIPELKNGKKKPHTAITEILALKARAKNIVLRIPGTNSTKGIGNKPTIIDITRDIIRCLSSFGFRYGT